ncbi:glycosyltransferase family 2 protein [Lysinibacillus sp. NPDC093190]|uniref:glycosyltransferase family 2 protein n=1 Tax=Lysinibacillus sp. NPDC093190 TaxID=3390575 RepID=UPI003D0793C1
MQLVSVIISNYNYEKYIREAVLSVINQSYQKYEIIIVDDGSIDNSLEIIGQLQQMYPKNIRVIAKENGGQASAFNKGFELAQGEIIAFLDADDYWYPDKLETIVYYHQFHKGIQHNLLINNEKKFTLLEDKVSKQKRGLELYGFMGTIPTSGLSFKREALTTIFPIPEADYRICADLYIKIMFLNYFDLFSLDTPKGNYRAHDTNYWYNSQWSSLEYNEITLKKLNKLREFEGKDIICKVGEVDAVANFMIESISLETNAKYIIYGTGKLAEKFYESLQEKIEIIGFSNSFVDDNGQMFLGKQVLTCDILLNNFVDYDYVLIASTMVLDIKTYLLQQGMDFTKLLVPKL